MGCSHRIDGSRGLGNDGRARAGASLTSIVLLCALSLEQALNLTQTVALIVSVAVAGLALVRTESERAKSQRRRSLERVLDAVLELQRTAISVAGTTGRGIEIDTARATLSALVEMAPVPMPQTALLYQPGVPTDKIVSQSQSSLLELRDAFDAV